MNVFKGIATIGLLVILMACEETKSYNGESLNGVWEVTELKSEVPFNQGYLCSVTHSAIDNNTLLIANFLDQYQDHDVSDPNYVLEAIISGNRITVTSQGIDDVSVNYGVGVIYNSDNFRIEYTYDYEGRQGSGSADFVRKN